MSAGGRLRRAVAGGLLATGVAALLVAAPNAANATDFLPYGWGSNSSLQLALAEQEAVQSPVKVRQPAEVAGQATVALSAGARHACSQLASGEVACWGANEFGQAGQDPSQSTSPKRVLGLGVSLGKPVVNLDAGDAHSCAVTVVGEVYCWGRNHSGQLGNALATDSSRPTKVEGLPAGQTAVAVALGGSHTCTLTDAGEVWCWGANGQGQLGTGTKFSAEVPQRVTGMPAGVTVASLAAGGNQTCVTGSDGLLYCWGANHHGQSGGGSDSPRVLAPESLTLPEGAGAAVNTAVGKGHACALTGTGGLYCWGRNHMGQLGNGALADSGTPIRVGGPLSDLPVVQVSAGAAHTCATGVNAETYCWGANGAGQLGDGTTDARAVPTQVLTAAASEKETRPAASVAAGGDFSLGLYAYAAKPGVPRDVQLSGSTLTWQPPLFTGTGGEVVSQYRISYIPEGQSKPALFATLAGTGTSVDLGLGCPEYAVCPLKGGPVEPGKTYRWTVAAVGSSGAASANARSTTEIWQGPGLPAPVTPAVAPPSMPVIDGLFGTTLSWQPPGYFGELGSNLAQYSIRVRALGERSFVEYASVPADRTSFDLAGACPVGAVCLKKSGALVPGVVYEVWVYAVGADGALSKVPRGGQPYSLLWG